MKLINEGLQNKLQIHSERLERQDKLISRLEEEIVHADEQCQEFLSYWNPNGDLKFINRVEHFYKHFILRSKVCHSDLFQFMKIISDGRESKE